MQDCQVIRPPQEQKINNANKDRPIELKRQFHKIREECIQDTGKKADELCRAYEDEIRPMESEEKELLRILTNFAKFKRKRENKNGALTQNILSLSQAAIGASPRSSLRSGRLW